jgi:protein TonB
MKKNSVFWVMLGLSVALHGLVIMGTERIGFSASSPVQEDKFVSTLKIIQVATTPQREAQSTPSVPIEEKAAEKPVEIPPEISVQEPIPDEEVQESNETQEREGENAETARESNETQEYNTGNNEGQEGEAGDKGTLADHEYNALLAYIKEYIDKNMAYPPMARRRNIEGVVSVYFEIERNGELVSISTSRSSGSSILDNAAVALVKKIPPLENLALDKILALNINITYELTE